MAEIKPGDTVYLVKYALSGGILKDTVTSTSEGGKRFYLLAHKYGGYNLGKDVFKSPSEAIFAANTMRIKKIAALKKQIAKLDEMEFEVKE